MLTRKQYAEVVEFDRKSRVDAMLENEKKSLDRRTNRYNYIVPKNPRRGRRGAKPDGRAEVVIVNVAVRLDMNYVPVVKEVMWMYPETGIQEYRDMSYYGIAGWTIRWRSDETRSRRKRGKEPFRIGKPVDREPPYKMAFKHGRPGFNRTYDETVNPEALAETRYKYCQYSDEAPCCTGLMEWLSLYRDEPKVELLAKAGLHCFINPAGLKALKCKRIFQWAKDNAKMLEEYRFSPITYVLWAARHDSTLEKARSHFDRVHNLSYMLDSMRWHLKYPGHDRAGIKLKIDYERLEGLLKKWHVDAYEYGRYVEHAFDAGLDLKNDGTLYPPTRGGRKAFMARLEDLERECARLEKIRERAEEKRRKAEEKVEKEWIAKTMKVRFKEIEAFQKSLRRTATLRGCGYTLVLAKTQKELRAEGRKMGNCVGCGTYGRGIVKGDSLIVMLGLKGKSYCDIEIDRRNWRVNQCYLKGNETPPEEVRKLAAQIAAFLKEEHKRHHKAGLFNVPRRKAA